MPIDSQTQQVERELPSPSSVVQKVLVLLNDDAVTMQALARALGADPAMTGRVLRLANSAASGPARSCLTLAEALQRLGVAAVRQVLVSFSLVDRYRKGHCAGFNYPSFWGQSLATGVAARHLASLAGMNQPADCFTLGLLARVGELALATMYPQAYGPLHRELYGASAERITSVEQTRLAADRYVLAGRMLKAWCLPDAAVAAVVASGEPANSGLVPGSAAMRLARILQIAVELGVLFDANKERDMTDRLLQVTRLCVLAGISPTELSERLAVIEEEWREWGAMLGLDLSGTAPLSLDLPPQAEIIPFPRVAVENGRPPAQERDLDALLAQRPEALAEAARRVLPRESIFSPSDVLAEAGQTMQPSPQPEGGLTGANSGLRILVAHPDSLGCASWLSLMESQQHRVNHVSTGEHALAALLDNPPEVMLCDLDLQQMDALTLFRNVRSSRPGKQIYLIATAPRDRAGALEAAFGAGVDDFISLPMQSGELTARLRAARRFIEMQDQLVADREQVAQLVTELAMANARLEQDAETDALTGIANRRRATEALLQAVNQAEETGTPLGVCLVDLDHFKRVNDTWGHPAGDEVLRQAAQTLQAYSRASDLVARFGGEEFLVIAPGTSVQNAAALAERLRAGVSRLRIPVGKEHISVTFSVGVSVYDPATSPRRRTPEALLHMADEALYRAKDSGRNRVCVAADRPTGDRAPARS